MTWLRAVSRRVLRHIVYDHASLREALRRIADRKLAINSVIDVGASDGRWSAVAERFWPHARYHLIEASDRWRPALDALTARKAAYSYSLAAAGPRNGEVSFARGSDAFGGAIDLAGTRSDIVPMVSIDSEVERFGLKPPYLLKLDTHGPEREILAGACVTLRQTNLIINEFYNFQSEGRRFPEMVAMIEAVGFHCVDLIQPLWRADGVLWQVDLAFLRNDRPEFSKVTFL